MAKTYQGKTVTVERTARQGDSGFDPAQDMVLVKFADGKTQVVLRSEVKDA